MKPSITLRRVLASWQLVAAITLVGGSAIAAPPKPHYVTINTVSDIPGVAHQTDADLVDPWGIVTGVEGNVHVADYVPGLATLYAPNGDLLNFSGTAGTNHSISFPLTSGTALPTGVVDNQKALLEETDPKLAASDTDDFIITSGTAHGRSNFIYGTEDGVIFGFNDSVNPNSAVVGPNSANQSGSGAGYTGVALSWSGTGSKITDLHHELFAANFAAEKIDVFDKTFTLLSDTNPLLTGTTSFTSAPPVAAPAGYTWSPFNVHTLDFKGKLVSTDKSELRRLLVVTYALHSGTAPTTEVAVVSGTSYGYAALYKTDGTFVQDLNTAAGQPLSAPWGIAVAHTPLPDGLSKPLVILIGSHGGYVTTSGTTTYVGGQIYAYGIDPTDRAKDAPNLGYLLKENGSTDGTPLVIEGLWGLRFGSRKSTANAYLAALGADLGEDTTHLYFSAGILQEDHGLLGRIVHEAAP